MGALRLMGEMGALKLDREFPIYPIYPICPIYPIRSYSPITTKKAVVLATAFSIISYLLLHKYLEQQRAICRNLGRCCCDGY